MIKAIIVAAGKGVRMGADRPKQFLTLAGQPILVHTLKAFDICDVIDQIILVVPGRDFEFCKKMIMAPADLRSPVRLVAGGRRRQDSVLNGLTAIAASEGIVLIHDGVRPLIPVKIIKACIQGAQRWGSCIPAIPPVDTPKRIDEKGVVRQTVDRNRLRMAQTPQAFQLPLIRKAYHEAKLNGWQATDDASLVERMGEKVHIIPGAQENIKITMIHDLAVAELYLSGRFDVKNGIQETG
jgi:2-C-methyl-D-erythritol 4-phosphate cytidylyltransferase